MKKEEVYPLTIVADRYGGTYSGAQYLAFNLFAGGIPDEALADLAQLLSDV